MYSVMLMAALTVGGQQADLGHRHGGCCGETAHCGRQHHHRGHGCCGESYGCGSCGSCGTCGYAGGCATCGVGGCANGVCGLSLNDAEAPATIVVSLPADAKLTIDDAATTSTSDHRVFVSPNLPTGKDFSYTLKAEISVNGKAQVVSQVVTVRAGEESHVTLAAPAGVAER